MLENKGFRVLNSGKIIFPDFSKPFSLKNKGFGVAKKKKKDFLVFENLGKSLCGISP